jgi:hypothetical protein
MNFNKRILKTGALAVIATVAFGFFAFRVSEWSKGLNSGFVVLGQSGGSGGGTGGTGTVTTTTKVIPQIAIGSFDNGLTRYSTFIQIVNTGSAGVTLSGSFYNPDGSASKTNLTANISSVGAVTSTLNAVTVAGNAALVLTGKNTGTAAGTVTWGKIVSTGAVTITTYLEIRDGITDVLLSRVGIGASAPDMTTFVIPRLRNTGTGVDTGFAIVNTGSTSATVTATLRDASGATINGASGASTAITLPGNTQIAKFAVDVFKLTNEPTGVNYQYITFTSTSAQIAATGLVIGAGEGGTLTSVPVNQLQ